MSQITANAVAVAVDRYNVIMGVLAQQENCRLVPHTTVQSHNNADLEYFDVRGKIEATPKTGRLTQTVFEEATIFARRGLSVQTITAAEMYDEDDPSIINFNIQSPILSSMNAGFNRAKDTQIINALDGPVTELNSSDGNKQPTTVNFDTDFQISSDVGGTESSLNHDKLLAILFKFRQLETVSLSTGELPCLLVSSYELNQILREIKNEVAFNGDMAAISAVSNIARNGGGQYFGFNWVISERLNTLDGTDDRRCFAFYKPGVIFGVNQGFKVDIDQDITQNMAWQMRGKIRTGAMRFIDDNVLRVLCNKNNTYNGV